jgi:hypothetical protein
MMTTIERERQTTRPPVEHKEEPPVVIPPTPPPKVGGVRWLWWLAALAAVVIVTTAVVLLVEDEEQLAYVNTETVGRPGQVLEVWDLTPAQPRPNIPAPRYPSTETIGPLGTVTEVWERPTRYSSTETIGPLGTTREVWERLPARPDVVTRGLPGTVLEVWDRPDVAIAAIADVPISLIELPLIAAGADATLLNVAVLEVSTDPVLTEVWDRLDVTVPGGTDWLPADVAFEGATSVAMVASAGLADEALLNVAGLDVSTAPIPIEVWHRPDYTGPMPADVVILTPSSDIATSAALADAALLNVAVLEVSTDPVLAEVWDRLDVTVPGGTDWLPTVDVPIPGVAPVVLSDITELADVALMNVAALDVSTDPLQHEIWGRADYTGPTPSS